MAADKHAEAKIPALRAPPIRDDGLQLDENRPLQRRFWDLQRISWFGFGVVAVAAVLGVTGSGGPLHKQTLDLAQARVELPRISRWEGSDDMTVTFTAPTDEHEFWINEAFFQRFGIEQIQPDPAQTTLVRGGQRFSFDAEESPPHDVTIEMRAMHFGLTRVEIAIGDETKSTHVIVLP